MSSQKYIRTSFDEEPVGGGTHDHLPLEPSSLNGRPGSPTSPGGAPVSPGVMYSTPPTLHCWARRTLFEKVFMVLISICAVLIVTLVILDISTFRHRAHNQLLAPQPLTNHCRVLDGVWYNQLGSEIILHHQHSGALSGEFRSAVERLNGTAGQTHSIISGAAPYDSPGSVFAFSVMWNDGESTTAWTGQCMSCDGKEVLLASWLLRSRVDTCVDKWKSTLIGQDTFTRHEQVPGPKKMLETNKPVESIKERRRSERTSDTGNAGGSTCNLEGTWYSEVGSEMLLESGAGRAITGEYRTAVEREKNAAGSSHSHVYGIGNVQDTNSTLALFVVWKEGASVTGWVGQCHVCAGGEEVLETTWLLRSKVATCDENWRSTLHGQSSFTRHPTKQGPRKALGIHTPRQLGEDQDISAATGNTHNLTSLISLLISCVLLYR